MATAAEFEAWMSKPLSFHPDSTIHQAGALVVEADDETLMVRWCSRNRTGGIWRSTANQWTLLTPVTFAEFLDYLDVQNIWPVAHRDSLAGRRWIKFHKLADGADRV